MSKPKAAGICSMCGKNPPVAKWRLEGGYWFEVCSKCVRLGWDISLRHGYAMGYAKGLRNGGKRVR